MLRLVETGHIHWQRQIETAPTHAAVIEVVRRYLATLPEAELAKLPEDCRPKPPSTPDEIGRWAVHVVTAEMKVSSESPAAGLLHQLAVIYAGATTRFAQLAQEARILRPGAAP